MKAATRHGFWLPIPGQGSGRAGVGHRLYDKNMRWFARLAIAMVVLLAGAGTAAANQVTSPSGQTQGFEVQAIPNKASKKARKKARAAAESPAQKGTALDLALTTGRVDGTKPSPPTKVTINIQKGYRFDAKGASQCPLSRVPLQCLLGRVGSGSIELDAYPENYLIPAIGPMTRDIWPFNGIVKKRIPSVVLYVNDPLTNMMFKGTLKKKTRGSYGNALEIPIPTIPTEPNPVTGQRGPNAAITRLQLRLQGRLLVARKVRRPGRKPVTKVGVINFVNNPTRCNGSWEFRADVTYESGETLSPTASVPCTS